MTSTTASNDRVLLQHARGALRMALQISHRDHPDFLRIYGGAILTSPGHEESPFGILLREFIALIDETDACVEAFWERRIRSEEESLSNPINRTDLSDIDAQLLQSYCMAIGIFHPEKKCFSGHVSIGALNAVAAERHDLIERFADILRQADRLIQFEPLSSMDEKITTDRYAWILNRDKKPPEQTEKEYDGVFKEIDEEG